MIKNILYRKTTSYAIIIAVLLCVNVVQISHANNRIILSDVTGETGINFKHVDGSSGKFYLMEAVSAGLALFDYDNDGDIDIYFLNGAALKGAEYKQIPKNALYRNDGNFKFTDVTDKSGTGDTGFGLGVTVGDYDNDGDQDIYLNNYGPNVLYRNNGDGSFNDVTKQAGVENGSHVGAGTCFLDIDNDGDLDLYVARYIDFSYEKSIVSIVKGFPAYTDPMFYQLSSDSLYLNNGDGTFVDVSDSSGISQYNGSSMGMICADYDNDGDTDIFVANDTMENYFFQNNGKGEFEEIGLMVGISYDINGVGYGSMGADCADYDNDGLLDLYVTSYVLQSATLYKNLDNGVFEDMTSSTGSGKGTFFNVTWGTGFVDFDNDGDKDIFVAAGFLADNVEQYRSDITYHARNQVLMNTGDGKFVNITDKAGDGLKVKLSSRGAGFDDLDNDGDIDVVILNAQSEPTILRNDTVNENHWIKILLRGMKTNRDGVGARVKVTTGKLMQIDEVHSGRGYQGHHGTILHFGLAKHKKIDSIEVNWIGGKTDILKNITADQVIIITEGQNLTK